VTATLASRDPVAEICASMPTCGTVSGIAAPYDRPGVWIKDLLDRSSTRVEWLRRGVFERSLVDWCPGLELREGHDGPFVGWLVHWEDRAQGLFTRFELHDSCEGRRVARRIRDGVLHSFSVAYLGDGHEVERQLPGGGSLICRRQAQLTHVAICGNPVFADAKILDYSIGRVG
jgi:HK97 family phage prohead protease